MEKAKTARVGRKLNEAHVLHIQRLVAAFISSPTKIKGKLADPEYVAVYGLEPVEISVSRISSLIASFTDLDIAVLRAEYLCDFGDIPLSYTKERVRELSELYHDIDAMKGVATVSGSRKKLSDSQKLVFKLRVLRQIGEEMDESIEALAAAIRDSRQPLTSKLTGGQIGEVAAILAAEAVRRQEEDDYAEPKR